MARDSDTSLVRMTAEVVTAYLQKNKLPADQVSEAIKAVHMSLSGLLGGGKGLVTTQKPAVSIRQSVKPDYIVCLEDGKKFKMLKRHLRTTYGLSPDQYRAKWGLPADYPIVAPNYAARRSAFAKKIGLGQSRGKKRRLKSK